MSVAPIPETEPVFSIRQTNLRMLMTECPAGAWAKAVEGRNIPSGEGALRGTAIHLVFARYAKHLFEVGRQTDYEAIEDIAAQVLRESPRMSFKQRFEVMEQARSIGSAFLLVPETYYGSEESFATIIPLSDGRTVRITGTVDLLQIDEEGFGHLTDYKSNHIIWPDSAVQEDFQLKCYSMLVLDTLPQIPAVKGHLWFGRYNLLVPQKGEAVWGREELVDFRAGIAETLEKFLDGKLKSAFLPGSWCQYCPRRRPGDCTQYRSWYGNTPKPILNERQARIAGRELIAIDNYRKVIQAQLKPWVNEHGNFQVGSGPKAETIGFHVSESERIPVEEFLRILHENGLDGILETPEANKLLTVVNGSSPHANKLAREIRHQKDIALWFEDVAKPTKKTTFGHKALVTDDEEEGEE